MQRSILMMTRFISLAICFLISSLPFNLQAQDVIKVQNGASITVQNGADIVVLGGINLDNGSSLVNNGSITLKQNGASGAANWTDNSITGYNHGTSKVVFNGNGGQSIINPNSFERIEVDASGHLTLGSNIQSNFGIGEASGSRI